MNNCGNSETKADPKPNHIRLHESINGVNEILDHLDVLLGKITEADKVPEPTPEPPSPSLRTLLVESPSFLNDKIDQAHKRIAQIDEALFS